MSLERHVRNAALVAGLPGSLLALAILWSGDYEAKLRWTLTPLVVLVWLGAAFAARERVAMTLRTVANLLGALREGDYSIRARDPRADEALGEVMIEVNALGDVLQRQRFHAVDAATLLQRVIEEIDVAIFTFDEHRRLRLVNRAGERMMAREAFRLLGKSAQELGLAGSLEGEPTRTFERSFPGQAGRWQCRRSAFREGGSPRTLLVLTDLSKALRDEERQAWQRLIRVIGHELNNSLAPIMSTASTLADLLRREPSPEIWRDDAERGMARIAERCASLNRFVAAYGRLARLPPPTRAPIPVASLVRRVVALEQRLAVAVLPGPDLVLDADADQLEQLLINLVKNAVDAVEERPAEGVSGSGTGDGSLDGPLDDDGAVEVLWRRRRGALELAIRDRGPGLANAANVFVPFFTTKPGGTGVGLLLCRQIAEAHGGVLELANRDDGPGCIARLRLPL